MGDEADGFKRLKAEKLRKQEDHWSQLDALTEEQWHRLDEQFREMRKNGALPKTTRRGKYKPDG